jgi:hypothetical protein
MSTSWKIEEGPEESSHPSTLGQATGPTVQTTQVQLSPNTSPRAAILTSDLNVPPSLPSVPRKVRIDRAAELERQLEAARIALQESEIASNSGSAASDVQSDHEQTWQVQVAALRAEVDRLRSALAVTDSAPPPAYEGEGESIATPLVVKQ